jgi:hypothetical protein
MYPTSSEYKAAIKKSHASTIVAEVFSGDTKVLTLYPTEGEISVDGTTRVRRAMRLTVSSPRPTYETYSQITYANLYNSYATYAIMTGAATTYGELSVGGQSVAVQVDSGLVPDNVADALMPYGNEIKISKGIEVTTSTPWTYAKLSSSYATYSALTSAYSFYGQLAQLTTDATQFELIPLGVFVITDVNIEDGSQGATIQIAGLDRSVRITRSKFVDMFNIANGTNAATAIASILQDRWANIKLAFSDTTATVNAVYLGSDTSSDPWADAQDIAQSVGMRLYFDQDGVCRLEPQRDYGNTTPDAIYEDGEANLITNITRRISTERTYNAVIVSGEGSGNTGSVYRAEVYDDDPASPTYQYGTYGIVPYFYSSPNINSGAQAALTAEALLQQLKGATEEVSWQGVSDPSLDAEDVVKIKNEGTKVDQVLVLDSFRVPLRPYEAMNAQARLVRTLTGEMVL